MRFYLTFIAGLYSFFIFATSIEANSDLQYDGSVGGHKYIDLGLPSKTLWATCNLGAEIPSEGGDYFAWGEVEPKEVFSWENYEFYEGWEYDPNNGIWYVVKDIGVNICGTKYDAATHHWGNGWKMPDEQQMYELKMLCWSQPVEINGVRGLNIYGPNGHSIFLPITGVSHWDGDPVYDTHYVGNYWSGESTTDDYTYNGYHIEPSQCAHSMWVELNSIILSRGQMVKAAGCNIRPVIDSKYSGIESIQETQTDNPILSISNRSIYFNRHIFGFCELRDLAGRILYYSSLNSSECQIPELPAGIYIFSLVEGNHLIGSKKIIIK